MSELLVILAVAAAFAVFAVLFRQQEAQSCHRADACGSSTDCAACDLASDPESNHVQR